MTFHAVHSPLYMVMNNPVLHQFISYLAGIKEELEAQPTKPVTIELSKTFIAEVRESFRQNILQGERQLHVLSHLLSSLLLDDRFELHSNVIGVLPDDEDRPFHIRERITSETLFSVTDIDLGNQMLDNFRYRQGRSWVSLELSANFVEYLPMSRPDTGVNRISSRVKAEEELWNKVTDELFGIDKLVSRDKHLRQFSKYVKDIFGIKVVCIDETRCLEVHENLRSTKVRDCKWENLGALQDFVMPEYQQSLNEPLFEFLETKDYLHCIESDSKKTGWRALKSVVSWHDRLFEIQVQPLDNYYLELDHMSGPSHSSFKLVRDSMRNELCKRIPLYGFYRDLLKMLFMDSEASFTCANASVVIK